MHAKPLQISLADFPGIILPPTTDIMLDLLTLLTTFPNLYLVNRPMMWDSFCML